MNKWIRKGLLALPFVGAGYGFGYLLGRGLKGAEGLGADPRWLWATPLIFFVVLALHELGHAAGGWIAGFRLYFLAVGPLRWDRTPEGGSFSFNRALSLWGGVAASMPAAEDPRGFTDLPRRMLWMVCGGPGASLLSAVLGCGLAYGMESGAPQLLWAVFGFFSATIAVATLIPMCAGGFKSDGQRILELSRTDAQRERYIASAVLSSLATTLRPREWPREMVEAATRIEDDSYDGVAAAWLRHAWHLDRRELAEAKQWLETTLAKVDCWPAAAQPIVYMTAAYFYAIEEADEARAREYSAKSQGAGFLPPEGKLMVDAAVAALDGRSDAVREAARRGKELAAKHPGSAGDAIRESFEVIEARAAR